MVNYKVKQSGPPRQYPYGAQRDDDTGKPKYSFLMVDMLMQEALHMEKGADKYGNSNYRKGITSMDALDSAWRHFIALMVGEPTEDHISAIKFNVNLIQHNKMYYADDPVINNLTQYYIETGFYNEDGTPNMERIKIAIPWI